MVDPYQLVLGVIALCLVVLTPIGLVLIFEATANGWRQTFRDLRHRIAEFIDRHRHPESFVGRNAVPLEQLVADLRRLRRLIESDEHRSAAQQLGTRLAYDRVLIDVCAMLDIDNELDADSGGMERDIERIRVEADLERAGVQLGDRRFGQAA